VWLPCVFRIARNFRAATWGRPYADRTPLRGGKRFRHLCHIARRIAACPNGAANQKAGLSQTCPIYRHTFGSQLAMKGESLYKIATLIGNSPRYARGTTQRYWLTP